MIDNLSFTQPRYQTTPLPFQRLEQVLLSSYYVPYFFLFTSFCLSSPPPTLHHSPPSRYLSLYFTATP